jgi:hypothetical protein
VLVRYSCRKKAEKNKPQTFTHMHFNSDQYMVVHHIVSFTFARQSLLSVCLVPLCNTYELSIIVHIIRLLMIHKERVRRNTLFVYMMRDANSVKNKGNIYNSDQVNTSFSVCFNLLKVPKIFIYHTSNC